MSLQIIFRDSSVVSVLGDIAALSDVFPLADGTIGVAIPGKVVDSAGEDVIIHVLSSVEYFDLYTGEWRRPNQPVQGTPGKVPFPATEPGARRS